MPDPSNPFLEFFDTEDTFDAPPNDEYLFEVVSFEFKRAGSSAKHAGAWQAHVRMDIMDDPAGITGAVWDNLLLEGDMRRELFRLKDFTKALIAVNPELYSVLVQPGFPGFDPATGVLSVPLSPDGEPDLMDWKNWFETVIGCRLGAVTRKERRKQRNENGVLEDTDRWDARISKYIKENMAPKTPVNKEDLPF